MSTNQIPNEDRLRDRYDRLLTSQPTDAEQDQVSVIEKAIAEEGKRKQKEIDELWERLFG